MQRENHANNKGENRQMGRFTYALCETYTPSIYRLKSGVNFCLVVWVAKGLCLNRPISVFGVLSGLSFESNRMLGAVGSLLIVLSTVTSVLSLVQLLFPWVSAGGFAGVFGLLSLVGLILFMIGLNGLANYYRDRAIFNNALYWIITNIVGGVVAAGLAMVVLFSVLSQIIAALAPFTPANPPTLDALLEALKPYVGYFIPVGVVVFAVAVVAIVFLMRAFNRLAVASGVGLFRVAGLLFLVGTVLAGVLALLVALLVFEALVPIRGILEITSVSGLVSLAAWIVATAAFFSLRAPAGQAVPQQMPQAVAPVAGQVKYCSRCGAENSLDAVFCVRCGEKLQA